MSWGMLLTLGGVAWCLLVAAAVLYGWWTAGDTDRQRQHFDRIERAVRRYDQARADGLGGLVVMAVMVCASFGLAWWLFVNFGGAR